MRRTAVFWLIGPFVLALVPAPAFAITLPAPQADARARAANSAFYVPPPGRDPLEQIRALEASGRGADARLLVAIAAVPRAVWFTSGRPSQVERWGRRTIERAANERQVPVLVAYDVPGRDCGGYSAGGAQTSADYAAWIDGYARGIGRAEAFEILEPDGVALAPDKCGNIADSDKPARQAERNAELQAAVDRLEKQPRTSVYLDAGHSHWLGVGEIAARLVAAGVHRAQGFFINVSNYQPTPQLDQFGTWIAKCI